MTGSCQHCGASLFRKSGERYKLRVQSRIVGFDAEGNADMVCPECGQDTKIPLRLDVAAVVAETPKPRIVQLSPSLVRRRPVPEPEPES